MAKGFEPYGGVLITVRVVPKVRAEMSHAAKQLGVSASDLYREAIEAWLIAYRRACAAAG